MRTIEIESWALRIISAVEAGKPFEDSRIELKADFIEPTRAARRIAAHANSAAGEPILWLIGVCEERGVIGVLPEDRTGWYEKVKAAFDGLYPAFQDVVLDAGGKMVVCLVFDTTRALYLVTNPDGGRITREVPWREGTATRTATREDLLRMFQPDVPMPEVEVLAGNVMYNDLTKDMKLASVSLKLYIIPRDERRLVIPFHRCSGHIVSGGKAVLDCSNIMIEKVPGPFSMGSLFRHGALHSAPEVTVKHDSEEIETNAYQAVINRPAMCTLRTSPNITLPQWEELSKPSVEVTIKPISRDNHGITLTVDFPAQFHRDGRISGWGTTEDAFF